MWISICMIVVGAVLFYKAKKDDSSENYKALALGLFAAVLFMVGCISLLFQCIVS